MRLDENFDQISSEKQQIGAFTGFMASISPITDKSKTYFFLTLPKPPKKPVVYTLMEKAVAAAELKQMPFIQFVGDQPVYTLIKELKNENPTKFKLILPVLGTFHTQMSFLSAIYKRTNGSGLSELLVAAGLIADGSVEQALRGKHYNRALRLLKLFYEGLSRLLIKNAKSAGINISQEIFN